MKLHRDGLRTMITIWCICILIMVICFFAIHPRNVSPLAYLIPISILLLGLMVWIGFFFRVPRRGNVKGDNVVTSVADGEVVIVEKVTEDEYIGGECIQVYEYRNFFNVHVNFGPVDGVVDYYQYHPGRYLLAWLPKSSELNEHSSIGLETPFGKVFFRQIAGTFARRIVTYNKPGDSVKKAEQCGIIKFGSRIDMFLPLDADIRVEVGDTVRACESVIATLNKG